MVFVNDGSKDHTWDKRLRKKILYQRNMFFWNGKNPQYLLGLEQADGDCIALWTDLQHPPEVLVKMYRLREDGFQVIEGVKASRGKESFIHKMFAKTDKIISDATGIDMSRASDFKLLDRQSR
ncbi:MAG: glycosyltransferase [Anaerostipes hadrus]